MMNYHKINRNEWLSLYPKTTSFLSHTELEQLTSKNDLLSIEDVNEIYLPLLRYLELYIMEYHHLQFDRSLFLNTKTPQAPFIIGIAGSVAVGKSTTARLLQKLCSHYFPQWKTQLVTTDGFLYSTKELKEKGLLDKKGFPESYNMKALLSFLNQVKQGDIAYAPLYSHQHYDVIPDQTLCVDHPDILIVEGINVLQNPENDQLYVRDFFDFSIYIDAKTDHIRKWYLDRFDLILDEAKHNSDDYYHALALEPRKKARAQAEHIWESVNQRNLEEYILPTKNRADLILHKSNNHFIDYLYIRKY